MTRLRGGAWIVSLLLAACCTAEDSSPDPFAAELLAQTPQRAGLWVQVGGSAELAAALAKDSAFLFHLWQGDAERAARARERLTAAKLYGRVTVEAGSLACLPYADRLANVAFVEDLPAFLDGGGSLKEAWRIVRPLGLLIAGQRAGAGRLDEAALKAQCAAAGIKDFEIWKSGGLWVKALKPWPAELDDWTHNRHDPGASNVSRDQALGPLESLRWVTGPVFPSGRDSTYYAGMVSSQGRSFYILPREHALPLVERGLRPGEESEAASTWLLARDAFNGLTLWSCPLVTKPRMHVGNNGSWLAADDGWVFAVRDNKLIGLDAATGKLRQDYGTTPKQAQRGKLLYRKGALLLVDRQEVRCLEAASAKERWKLAPASCEDAILCGETLICHENQKELAAYEMAGGRELWRQDAGGALAGLSGKDGRVVAVQIARNSGKAQVNVHSAADGKVLWKRECAVDQQAKSMTVLDAGGLVWIQQQSAKGAPTAMRWEGCDPANGGLKREVDLPGLRSAGCMDDVATERYFVFKRPPDFLSWEDGKLHPFKGARAGCRTGAILANGLYYTFPNVCMCVRGEVRGYTALAPASPGEPAHDAPESAARLERFAQAPAETKHAPGAWPMYRRDARRSAFTPAPISGKLRMQWQARLDDQAPPPRALAEAWSGKALAANRLTAPVVAAGLAVAGVVESHQVAACDAVTGERRWTFSAGGRLDAPPSYHAGLWLLGSKDGCVYALRAQDGKPVWRYRAAPAEQRIAAFGQLESPWPVMGGVLVEQGVACFVAGRSTAFAEGVMRFGLEPRSGKLLWFERETSASSKSGFTPDLLVADGSGLWVGGFHAGFEAASGKRNGRRASEALQAGTGGNLSTANLLDCGWHWSDGTLGRFHTQHYAGLSAQLLAFDEARVYAFRRAYRKRHEHLPAELLCQAKGKPEALWSHALPEHVQAVAMAVAGETLFVACTAGNNASQPGELRALSAQDGTLRYALPLGAAPAAEGIAIAQGRLYLTTQDGQMLCFAQE